MLAKARDESHYFPNGVKSRLTLLILSGLDHNNHVLLLLYQSFLMRKVDRKQLEDFPPMCAVSFAALFRHPLGAARPSGSDVEVPFVHDIYAPS